MVRYIAWTAICCGISFQSAVCAEEKTKPIFIKSFPAPVVDVNASADKLTPAEKQVISAALEKVLRDADALLNSGKPAEAYKLLEPLDFEYSGNVRFDYLLGISALDSGMPDKATLALERVLSVDPNFAGARLDMARAYFQLGDLLRAKTEFDAVMKQNPPEAARLTINKYLDAISAAEQAQKTHYFGYAEGSFGRDSNVNNSTSQSEIGVPAFGNIVFTLSPTSLKTPDNYYSAAAGGEVSHSLTDHWGVYGGMDLRKRNNQSMTNFDSGSVDTRAGGTLARGDDIFRAGVTFSQFEVAHAKNRNAYGLTGDWRHSISPRNQFNLFGQYGRNRFADGSMQINDFDLTVVGAGLLHILEDGKAALFGSINWAGERAVNDRADGNKIGYGLRVGGQTSFHESTEVYANVGYQIGRYDKENVAFLTNRNDKQYDVSLGCNWHLDKFWTVRPQASYTKNNSDIAIYSFDRLDASITVRRDFR